MTDIALIQDIYRRYIYQVKQIYSKCECSIIKIISAWEFTGETNGIF
jgi:hypothetical protein